MRQRYLIWLLSLLSYFMIAGFAADNKAYAGNIVIIKPGTTVTLHAATQAAAAYQWYKDGKPIPLAFLVDYKTGEEGVYTVVAFNSQGCPSPVSDAIEVKIAPVLIITAQDKTRVYGTPNPGFTYTYSGFEPGDNATMLPTPPTATTPANIQSNVGAYPIVPGGAVWPKYLIKYVNATLTVTPAPLVITAKSDAKYKDGQPYTPRNGVTYSGFVNGDGPKVLQGNLTYSGPAIGAINDGQYSIMPSGFTAGNYQITYKPGILSITDKLVDMSVIKVSESRSVSVGETFEYSLTVENKSVIAATQVQLKDALPPELDYVGTVGPTAGTASYDANTRTITWLVGNMAANSKAVLALRVKANTHGTVKNSASLTSLEADSNPANNTSTDTKEIGGLYIPNVFTPNNDGKNDTFVIPNLPYYPDNEISIFNRWGNMVYQKKGYQGEWSAPGLNEGTYFYILKVNTSTKTDVYKGYVTLLRSAVNK